MGKKSNLKRLRREAGLKQEKRKSKSLDGTPIEALYRLKNFSRSKYVSESMANYRNHIQTLAVEVKRRWNELLYKLRTHENEKRTKTRS